MTRYYSGCWINFQHHGPNKGHVSICVQEVNAKDEVIEVHRKVISLPDVLPHEAEIVAAVLPGAIHYSETEHGAKLRAAGEELARKAKIG